MKHGLFDPVLAFFKRINMNSSALNQNQLPESILHANEFEDGLHDEALDLIPTAKGTYAKMSAFSIAS